jgi:hypothetical protein
VTERGFGVSSTGEAVRAAAGLHPRKSNGCDRYGLRNGSKINCPLSLSPPEGEGMRAQAIHNDLMATLGNEAVTYRTVTKYLRTAQFDLDSSSPHLTSASGRAILATLEEKPFSSVREPLISRSLAFTEN